MLRDAHIANIPNSRVIAPKKLDMIETNRLFIRPFEMTDIDEAKWFQDKELMKFIPGGADKDTEQTGKRILGYIKHFNDYGFSKYILIDKYSKETIGDAGIMYLNGGDRVELGYRIKRDYWGQGLATEAANILTDHFFKLKIGNTLYAIASPDNHISIKILTDKLKFIYQKNEILFGTEMNLYSFSE